MQEIHHEHKDSVKTYGTSFGSKMSRNLHAAFFGSLATWEQRLRRNQAELTVEKNKTTFGCRVFVSFSTEKQQQLALREMSCGLVPAKLNSPGAVKDTYKWKHKHVLDVQEPGEPEDVLWEASDIATVDSSPPSHLTPTPPPRTSTGRPGSKRSRAP